MHCILIVLLRTPMSRYLTRHGRSCHHGGLAAAMSWVVAANKMMQSLLVKLGVSAILFHTTSAFSAISPSLQSSFAPHNFGPASSRSDNILYTAERPGNPPGKRDLVSDDKVREWIDYIQSRGVAHVIALLDESELDNYSNLPLLYQQAGLDYTRQSMNDVDVAANIYQILQDCDQAQTKVVTHCTGGIGRCGRVSAGWLCVKYGLSAQEATEETLECAAQHNIHRAGNAELLLDWLRTSGIEPSSGTPLSP